MKIAYLANVRIPSERAHATQIVQMCQAFGETGNKVDLFANTRVQSYNDELARQYNLVPQFTLHRISHGWIRSGWKWTFVFSELYFSLSALVSLRQSNYDVVYSRHEWILWFLCFFLPVEKFVWESHEAKYTLPARNILKRGVKTVCISEGVKSEYVRRGHHKDQFLVAHDGIDASFFGVLESKKEARNRLGIESDKPVVMYIGGFEAWKGAHTFLEAAALAPSFHFVAIGGDVASIAILKRRYPAVQFLGPRPYAELPNNQQAADILVIPNSGKEKLGSTYTSPLKLFAHLSAKKPILCSNVTSLTNVVSEKEVWFFEPDVPDNLAISLNRVFDNPDVSKKCKRTYMLSKKFLWSRRAQTIRDFINNQAQ